MAMTTLDDISYNDLTHNCQVLKTRRNKPVIMERPDHLIIKHIYHRKGLSSSRIWPYAKRFAKRSLELEAKGILAPQVHNVYRVPSKACDLVTYPKISGVSVRQLSEINQTDILTQSIHFIAMLHEQGVFFRDLHFGNVIKNDSTFALIDLASVKCQSKPLTKKQRIRNLSHLFNDYDDRPLIEHFGIERFITVYNACASIGLKASEIEKRLL